MKLLKGYETRGIRQCNNLLPLQFVMFTPPVKIPTTGTGGGNSGKGWFPSRIIA